MIAHANGSNRPTKSLQKLTKAIIEIQQTTDTPIPELIFDLLYSASAVCAGFHSEVGDEIPHEQIEKAAMALSVYLHKKFEALNK